jgi:hypothetical protein
MSFPGRAPRRRQERLFKNARCGRRTETLGILELAASNGLLDLPAALDCLLGTNFRVSPKLVDKLLERDANRRRTI